MSLTRLLFIPLLFLSYSLCAQTATNLFNEGRDYRDSGKKNKAIRLFEQALERAESDYNRKLQIKCHIELAELKGNVVNYKEALEHYKAFTELYKKDLKAENIALEKSVNSLSDSVSNLESEVEDGIVEIERKAKAIDSLTTEQLQADLAIKDLELENQKGQLKLQESELELRDSELELKDSENKRNILFSVIGLVVVVLAFAIYGYIRKRRMNKTMFQKNRQIIEEKDKSEELLLNILPRLIADELKEKGKTSSSRHEVATVMFTDFKGFTMYAEKHTPEELVAKIDQYFRAFDQIMEKYGIEKIKTIGDAYMCVSGIPQHTPDHAAKMIQAAFEMQLFVSEMIKDEKKEGTGLEMRIGIHCGPLVSGVVGSKKFAYDVWGDTVNIAARMEQSGLVGTVNVSESVYQLTQDQFDFDYRGEVEAKNKGKMKMYLVNKAS